MALLLLLGWPATQGRSCFQGVVGGLASKPIIFRAAAASTIPKPQRPINTFLPPNVNAREIGNIISYFAPVRKRMYKGATTTRRTRRRETVNLLEFYFLGGHLHEKENGK